MAHFKDQPWESPEEIDRIQRRRQIRQRLQAEFNRTFYNPYRQSHHIEFMDPAVSRYTAMRASIFEHWKPNWPSFWRWSFLTFIPIALLSFRLQYYMKEVDKECRDGTMPYEKRDYRRI